MDELQTLSALALALAGLSWAMPRAGRRLDLSRAKHRSLAGHSRVAKRVAALIPGYAYDESRFFKSDGAPADVVQRRRIGFARLAALYARRFERSTQMTAQARVGLSDLQFTGSYRVPFQYSPYLRRQLVRAGQRHGAADGLPVGRRMNARPRPAFAQGPRATVHRTVPGR